MAQAFKMKNEQYFEFMRTSTPAEIRLKGMWNVSQIEKINQALDKAQLFKTLVSNCVVDCANLTEMDSSGAFLVAKLKKIHKAQLINLVPRFQKLIDRIESFPVHSKKSAEEKNFFTAQTIEIGEKAEEILKDSLLLFSFFGQMLIILIQSLLKPLSLRWTSLFHHMKIIGFDSLPIIGLLTFLVGIVIAYQGAGQLQKFGADIYTVNLVGIGTLRELGILLTAVILAGRTGSSITAQIGTMAVNEEIDALRTIGVNPLEVLVVPRILALILVLPLLTFFADIMALWGGMIGCYLLLDINANQYIAQLQQAVPVMAFWVGLMKAPIFAFIIGLVSCFEGLKVRGSAESVGLHTTSSVVKSIFIIIVFDAIFSVLLVYFDI